MAVSYAKNKKHIYKWVENNTEKYNELCKLKMRRKRTLDYLVKTYNTDLANEIMRLLNISI